jgi:hypothetical protein
LGKIGFHRARVPSTPGMKSSAKHVMEGNETEGTPQDAQITP